ncbi:MAG: ABC transporter permease subunit [Bacillota bacterium]|nr:ABC transporter permease subunit [Bacillota bacterium]
MGRLGVLVEKELRQVRWVLWVGLGLTLLVGLSLPYFYRFLSRIAGAGAMLPGLSGEILRQLADFRVYLWANWYGKNLYQNLTVIALVLGAGALAGERARGTLPFLLTLPVSRRQAVAAKVMAGAVVLALCTVIPTLGVWAASPWLGGESAPEGFLLGMPLAWAGSLVVLGVAVLASVFAHDGVRAGVGAGVVCLALAVPGWFRSTFFLSFFWHMKAFAIMAGPGFPWASLLVLLGAALVLFWASTVAVGCRDL